MCCNLQRGGSWSPFHGRDPLVCVTLQHRCPLTEEHLPGYSLRGFPGGRQAKEQNDVGSKKGERKEGAGERDREGNDRREVDPVWNSEHS